MAQTERRLIDATTDTTRELELTESPTDSIELGINAKGDPQWTVKAYGRTPADISQRLAELRRIAEQHSADIRTNKPH